MIGECLFGQIDPFATKAPALTIEWLVLGELSKTMVASGLGATKPRGVEGRERLADAAAVPARELLPYRLDYLAAARDLLQRLGGILAQLRQPLAAAMIRGRGCCDDTLAFDILWPGLV